MHRATHVVYKCCFSIELDNHGHPALSYRANQGPKFKLTLVGRRANVRYKMSNFRMNIFGQKRDISGVHFPHESKYVLVQFSCFV